MSETTVADVPPTNRNITITYQDGRTETYPITARVEYDAMLTDPSVGTHPGILGWHIAWHAAGKSTDQIEEWVNTVTDFKMGAKPVPPAQGAPQS